MIHHIKIVYGLLIRVRMIEAEKYLEKFYNNFKYKDKDIVFKFLKDFGSHLYIKNYYNELSSFKFDNNLDSIEIYNKIIDFYYKKYTKNLKQYTVSERVESIYKINKVQRNKLKKDNFIIDYIFDDRNTEFNSKTKNYEFRRKQKKLTNTSKNITKRKFIFFYKSGNHKYKNNWNKQDKFGVDILNYCLMYGILKKMIDNRLLKNFNELEITPTYHRNIPNIFKVLNYNIKFYNKPEFISNVCQYSNTLYPYGMGYESACCYTVNLVCSTIYLQKQYVSKWHDYIHLPFYFSKGKIIDGKQYTDGGYDNDDTELFGKYGLVGHNYYERVKRVSKNRNIDNLFKTFVEKVIELDNYICV